MHLHVNGKHWSKTWLKLNVSEEGFPDNRVLANPAWNTNFASYTTEAYRRQILLVGKWWFGSELGSNPVHQNLWEAVIEKNKVTCHMPLGFSWNNLGSKKICTYGLGGMLLAFRNVQTIVILSHSWWIYRVAH